MVREKNVENKTYLSKAKYCAGLQCPKILWMDKNMPEQKAKQDDSRFLIGNIVGDLAMGYFGEYTEVYFDQNNLSGMLEETNRKLNEGKDIITEASFSNGSNFCSVDILRKIGNSYEIIEVKSSSGTLGDNKDKNANVYFDDMSYQYYVLTNCGLNISKVSLLRLNKKYYRQGDIDIQELFFLTDCTDVIKKRQKELPVNIEKIRKIASQKTEPISKIGHRCNNPYFCEYENWCFRNLPEYNVFKIGWGMKMKMKESAFCNGLITFEEIASSELDLQEN